jgi:hypothetical protein
MDDVVAIKVRDAKRGWVGFVTWGRLWGALNEEKLLETIRPHFCGFGISEPSEINVCNSLREIESGEYFYEAIIAFSWKTPPFGDAYKAWKKKRRKALQSGGEIYFVGSLEP